MGVGIRGEALVALCVIATRGLMAHRLQVILFIAPIVTLDTVALNGAWSCNVQSCYLIIHHHQTIINPSIIAKH